MAISDSFKAMLPRDPDGWDSEPTEDDYKAFELWAVSNFGRIAYEAYLMGSRDDI